MTQSERNTPQSTSWLEQRWRINWEVLAYVVIFVLAVFTRFYILGERVMSHDESLHTRFSYNLYNEGNFQHTPLMHGPILFHMVALSYALFGDNDFTARIYTSVVGVMMVLSPLLFRFWLGRWGALIASVLLLISPLIMYYNRYIREDTPAIMAGILMIWAILMYLSGPEGQRRRAHWLYVLAFGMIWNLGTKETAFIYIAIFGIFLAIYWFVRLAQHFWRNNGRDVFNIIMLGMLLGGFFSLGMYIVLDIIQFDLIGGTRPFATLAPSLQQTFFVWTFLALAVIVLLLFGTWAWVYRSRMANLFTPNQFGVMALVFGIAMLTALAFVVLEEVSHTGNELTTDEGTPSTTALRWLPMLLTWAACVAMSAFFIVFRRKPDDIPADTQNNIAGSRVWGVLDLFPEFDVMVVIGSLILPWATALIPYLMKGTAEDFTLIGESLPVFLSSLIRNLPEVGTTAQVGQFVIGFLAWLPLMVTSLVVGLSWNWRRYLLVCAVFYSVFVFFFTTVFTNMSGLGSGMIYSLGYWLEQQGVRRGSQPQYYYLLVIMPFYEFLPVIGGGLAMLAGMLHFWRVRRADEERKQLEAFAAEAQTTIEDIAVAHEDALDDSHAQVRREESFDEPRKKRKREEMLAWANSAQSRWLDSVPFLWFWAWLAVWNLLAFSLAGEKMPWLGTHLTFPLIFLTAWFLAGVVERIDLALFAKSGWILLLVLGVLLITATQVIGILVVGNPFGGLSAQQLRETQGFFGSVFAAGFTLGLVYRFARRIGWRHVRQMTLVAVFLVLGGLTLRSAWMASFINYDNANEFLVYAHGAPAVKRVLAQIEEMSLRTTDGRDLRFAYDNEVSWPYSWYFRNFPNAVYVGENPTVQNLDNTIFVVVGGGKRARVEPILEDRYQRFDYIRLWWPMQEYFYLSVDRVNNLLDFSATNTQAAQLRRGIFDIWWSRDYSTYGKAINKDFSLTKWPVSDTMHVYIRKDFAAQIWAYGVGDGGVSNPLAAIEQNQCTANWQPLQAEQILIAEGVPMSRPLGMGFDADGNLYVAEENSFRVSIFDREGRYVRSLGAAGTPSREGLFFSRPNSVSVAPDGTVYVADTWNFVIQAIGEDEMPKVQWGQPVTVGFGVPAEPTDGFWAPRDVRVDARGRVYVADTGNKRVRVYTVDGGLARWLYDIGSGGSGLGQLDEPAGLAFHPVDGRLFIADTWNRRVSVFSADGLFLNSFSVRGWYETLGNLPYLAIDGARELLYVTDPDSARVLVYTTAGECVGSFGAAAGEAPTRGQFRQANGVAVDAQGYVYVSDGVLNRILKFAPFPMQSSPAQSEGGAAKDSAPISVPLAELTAEAIESSAEPAE